MKLQLQPINFDEACEFIRRYHRHHESAQGWKFGIAVNDGEKIVGVCMIGRPVSRHLDDGWTMEVTRSCTDGTPHVNSMMYAAAWRACRAMGYRKLITYTLTTEPGTTFKALQWKCLGEAGGGSWSVPSRLRIDKHPTAKKLLWEIGEES